MTTKEKKRQPGRPPKASAVRTRPKASAVRKRTQPEPRKTPAEVVYTQPKPFSRGRFLLRLATVIAVVAALIFGMSIFFKVATVEVSGAEKYTPWEVREASGIQDGENLLTLSRSRITARILSELPYVKQVNGVIIRLPDTVVIDITELDVVYSIQAGDNTWWLIDADGDVVEQISGADADAYTRLEGVLLDTPTVGKKAAALETASNETTAEGETVPVTVYAAERLETQLMILQYLEDNGILGEMTSIDVSDMGNIELWYGLRYQVQLGDSSRLSYKIGTMKAVIDQEPDHQSGMLDISFTVKENQVVYTPFP